jgi:murein DD-endopeptidase MepM/ murein hydrolase activator NlpD
MAIYKEPFPATTRGDHFGNLAEYRNGRPHRGQDYAPKAGSLIPSITEGQVIANEWSEVLGWTITQTTTDGKYVLYAHLAEQPKLSKGHKLKLGDAIGKVGSTGSASTGPHLHLAIATSKNVAQCVYEKLVDPLAYITANIVAAKAKATKGKK